MKDTFHETKVVASLVPAVQSATLKGTAVDLQGFGAAAMAVTTGAVAGDGDYTVVMQESDTTTDSGFTNVGADDLIGATPATLEANRVYWTGYIGKRRYVRAVITKNGGTSIVAGAAFVLSHPALAPVAA